MATSLTLRRGSRQVNEKLDTRKIVGTAIAENDVESIKSLLLERDKTFLRYRHWAEFFAEDVEALDEVSQEEFRSTLMKIAGDKLCAYLRSALQSSDDEQVALLILNRRPDLFVKRLDDELPFNMAASNGQAKVLVRFLEYIKTTGQQHLLFPSIVTDGYTEPLEQKSRQPTTVLERATERGYLDIVKSLVVFDSRLLDRGYPLHKAVRGGHLDVVEYLLEKKSDLVERFMPGSYRSVLFEERTKGQDDESSKEIDRLLVAHIIRGGSSNKSPSMIKKLLRGPRDQHPEICLDLSVFSQTTHQFKPFVDGLVQEQQLFNMKFYPTLLYVQFPFLNSKAHGGGPKIVGQQAERILQWLRFQKGVSEIVKLRVPGSYPRAESEEVIGKALDGFSVDLLDWEVLDLSIDIILKSSTRNVEELCLYSSGNWGVLQQWSGTEGVTLLPKLRTLKITLIKGMISEELENEYLAGLRARLTNRSLANLQARDPPVAFEAIAGPWRGSESLFGSTIGEDDPQEYSFVASPSYEQMLTCLRTTVTITKLKKFLDFYTSCDRDSYEHTKVAIIDNGIDGTLSSFSKIIIDGVSLVEDHNGHESPWWLASHPHGTQMASFIHQLDPFCYLYIAKVCDESVSIDADLVAQAITWAIERKVDIISMSLAMPVGSPALKTAVETAKMHNIVMVGSRGDRGDNQDPVFPADYDEVLSISSTGSTGKRVDSTETNAQYFFQGENVSIPAEPSYLQSQKHASGSSVATALAAGIAALVLSCRRLGDEDNDIDRIKTVKTVFDRMSTDQDRYVKPWKVFEDQRMDKQEGLSWLRARFGSKGDFCC